MPQEQLPRRFSRTKKFLAFFFLTFAVTAVGLYMLNRSLEVKKIELVSEEKNEKLIGIENFYYSNLFLLSEDEIKKTLIEANPGVKSIGVEKKYPDGLKITAVYDQGTSLLVVDQGYFILSPEGRIIAKTKQKTAQLPLINYYQKLHYTSYQTGDLIDLKDIATTLHFLQKTRDLGLQTSSIDINGFNMIRLQLENKMILFTTEKSIQDQDYQLEILIRQFKVEGRDFKTLDFRFDKPIVTLQ